MGTSLRKMYDAELMALDTMLARMGHAAGGAIESAMTALRTGDAEHPSRWESLRISSRRTS